MWASVTPLQFQFKKHSKADDILIDIRFDSGCHGDDECFDADGKYV